MTCFSPSFRGTRWDGCGGEEGGGLGGSWPTEDSGILIHVAP